MTAKRFQRINNCTPEQIAPGVWAAKDEHGLERARVEGVKSEKKALDMMLAMIYRDNRIEAMQRDGWACVRCGSTRNLSCHHKVHRGIGAANRDDRLANLESLCNFCHEKAHGGK